MDITLKAKYLISTLEHKPSMRLGTIKVSVCLSEEQYNHLTVLCPGLPE